MMKEFKAKHPNLHSLMIALFMSIFVLVFMESDFGVGPEVERNVYLRVVYTAALCLLMSDVLECAYIARGEHRNIRSPHFWIYAVYTGYFWTVSMVLFFWGGSESVKGPLLQWGVGGTLFGLATAWLNPKYDKTLQNRYDLSKPMTDNALGVFYFIWPVLLILVIIGLIAFPPTKGWDENYFLFMLVLYGSLFPLYRFKKERFWVDMIPKIIGTILLFFGLLFL